MCSNDKAGVRSRPRTHRSESPSGYSSAGCSSAEPASASPVLTLYISCRTCRNPAADNNAVSYLRCLSHRVQSNTYSLRRKAAEPAALGKLFLNSNSRFSLLHLSDHDGLWINIVVVLRVD